MKKKILILSVLIVSACEKIHYYPDKEFHEVKTLFLCHRGGGSEEYSTIQQNTLDATKKGFSTIDGVEVDIQISKDQTIWLSHSSTPDSCNGREYSCFAETSDNEIIQLDSCKGPGYIISRLDDVLFDMSKNYPEKFISLDLKAWPPCGIGSAGILGDMNLMADKVFILVQKYHLEHHVFIESETTTLLTYVKKNCPGIETYLETTGDFERGIQIALEENYTGISFKYKYDEAITGEHVQMIRRKGLKIQLYTVDNEDDLREALYINPDFIQTDNIEYVKKINQ
jgi:glycerophosphoryl diester phosphodiesterase